MNKLAALLILALALSAIAQQPADQRSPEVIRLEQEAAAHAEMQRQEIVNLENEAARAIQLNNPTFFRRVYSDDFAGTLSHGQPVNKTSFIAAVQAPDIKYDSFNAGDISIRIYQETAVATALWSARGTFKGQRFDSGMRVIHVYINGPRGWHVVAGQSTVLPPGAPLPL
jgi:ketosteroid isomerase-like protein